MKLWDEKTIAQYDGREEKPVYIVYQGRIYDVSTSELWRDGFHMKRHRAGRDLTDFLSAAPHGEEVFSRYPMVGILKEREGHDALPLPAPLSRLLDRFPILRRHPHPVAVHFPVVFFLSVLVCDVLSLLTGRTVFHDTSLLCLYAGLLTLPGAMMTGFFTWWLNYLAQLMPAVSKKVLLSSLLLVLSTAALYLRIQVTDILHPFRLVTMLYLLLVLSFWPLVITIGYLGGSLVFPHKK